MVLFGKRFLSSLVRDTTANVLAISAAAMIPLVIVVGSTVDISRYYMATSRLQNACDAGALAARKSMTSTTFADDDRNQGLAFFDNNYSDGTFNLESLTRDYTADANGVVSGAATGTLPTSLMGIFGFGSFDISVECSAEINIANTDVVFVMDMSHSMNCTISDGSSCGSATEAPGAKINDLRNAVMSFHGVVDGATSAAAQVRYGMVNYGSQVNVGGSIPSQYMLTEAAYQTRVPQLKPETLLISNTINSLTRKSSENWWYQSDWDRVDDIDSESECRDAADDIAAALSDTYIEGTLQENTVVSTSTTEGSIITTQLTGRARFRKSYSEYKWKNNGKKCEARQNNRRYYADMDATIVEELTGNDVFDQWLYTYNDGEDPLAPKWDLTSLYDDNAISLPTGNDGSDQTHNWEGCIEEAGTTWDTNFDSLPAGAHDLNINLVPSSDEQRWKPALSSLVYERRNGWNRTQNDLTESDNNGQSNPQFFCPPASQRLREMDTADMSSYLSAANGFRASGWTYHDIGMIWGARFISPRGMFSADNAAAPNGDAIARHIVFLTDGIQNINDQTYSPYGMHWWDRRTTGSDDDDDLEAVHAARFQAACRQARSENIAVWVVAFGTTLTDNLRNCATTGRAFTATDAAGLNDAFNEIAERIASLRLTS